MFVAGLQGKELPQADTQQQPVSPAEPVQLKLEASELHRAVSVTLVPQQTGSAGQHQGAPDGVEPEAAVFLRERVVAVTEQAACAPVPEQGWSNTVECQQVMSEQ